MKSDSTTIAPDLSVYDEDTDIHFSIEVIAELTGIDPKPSSTTKLRALSVLLSARLEMTSYSTSSACVSSDGLSTYARPVR